MFWDKAAVLYDLFEDYYNGMVNDELCRRVADLMEEDDVVLECACGTGMISRHIALNCRKLLATDYSLGMLKRARQKCRMYPNITFRRANIMELPCKGERFDKVVAANVIHLLDNPKGAIAELERVCKPGGKIIIPTYVNNENAGAPGMFIKALETFGADFKKQFDYQSYQEFFADLGYTDLTFDLVEGKMPCAIAVITRKK